MTINDLNQLAEYHLNVGERLMRTAKQEAELGFRSSQDTHAKALFHLNAHKNLTGLAKAFQQFTPLLTTAG